jgi:acyl carrier protein
MTQRDMIEKEIIEMIIDIKGYDINTEISIQKKKFFEDFDFDSIDIMELVVRMEEKYCVDFAKEGVLGILNNCDELIQYLEEKRKL